MQIKSLLVVLALITVSPVIYAKSTTQLLPEVEQILKVELDESTLNQNGYVALLGIDAPEGMDSKELGRKIALAEAKKIREAIQKEDATLLEKGANIKAYYGGKASLELKLPNDYKLICSDLHDYSCLKKVTEKKSQLEQMLKDNQTLYTRYKELITLPNYSTTQMTIGSFFPDYMVMMRLSDIRLRQAALLINEGKLDSGLAIFQQEIAFSKRIMASKAGLIDQMVTLRRLQAIYHTLSELLDTPQLANELANPKLLALLKPFTKQEQQAAANALTFERYFQLTVLAAANKEYLIENIDSFLPNFKEDIPLTYNKKATLNASYQKFMGIINIAKIPLPEAAEYLSVLQNTHKSEPKTRAEIYNKYDKNNFIGEAVLYSVPSYEVYILRVYNLVNYLTLVNAKLAIKQAGINKAEVPEFLIQLGDKAQNPYSHELFDWDADKQLLSSNWLDGGKNHNQDGERASVYIKFDH